MTLVKLTEKQIHALEAIDKLLGQFVASQYGLVIHKHYRKHAQVYQEFIQKRLELKRAVMDFFKEQQGRLPQLVALHLVFDEAEDLVSTNWQVEDATLSDRLSPIIMSLHGIGEDSVHADTGTTVGMGRMNSPQLQFLKDHVIPVAKDINSTTRNDLLDVVRKSIALGETRDEMTDRLNDILNNPVRARMIAQTESVRAFSQGRLAVGREYGFTQKQWSAQDNACPVCAGVDGETVNIDSEFSIGVQSPPAHPNCQCSDDLVK
jgi:SPP1 gp7 family putative phage head morphogenesis protein